MALDGRLGAVFYMCAGRPVSLLLEAAFGSLSEETGTMVKSLRFLMLTLTRLAVGLGASSLPGVCKQRRKPRSRLRPRRLVRNDWVPR